MVAMDYISETIYKLCLHTEYYLETTQAKTTQVEMSCTSVQEHARPCTTPAIMSLQDLFMQNLLQDSAFVSLHWV